MGTVDNVERVLERVLDTIGTRYDNVQGNAIPNLGSGNVVSHLDLGFTTFGERL